MKLSRLFESPKQRSAARGPWIATEDVKSFLAFCESKGCKTRVHTGLSSQGYQVQYAGHWMALLWNKGFRRYTVDSRLEPLMQGFSAER